MRWGDTTRWHLLAYHLLWQWTSSIGPLRLSHVLSICQMWLCRCFLRKWEEQLFCQWTHRGVPRESQLSQRHQHLNLNFKGFWVHQWNIKFGLPSTTHFSSSTKRKIAKAIHSSLTTIILSSNGLIVANALTPTTATRKSMQKFPGECSTFIYPSGLQDHRLV